MTVSHQFLDAAHQFGLDNMGATAALNTLNQSILGDVLETNTSWTRITMQTILKSRKVSVKMCKWHRALKAPLRPIFITMCSSNCQMML